MLFRFRAILHELQRQVQKHGSIVGPTTPTLKRRAIRIYGYRLTASGLSRSINPETFFPDARYVDIDNFGTGVQNRYFEIIYNEETGKIEGFTLEDLQEFLGALYADHQTFIVRPSPDIVGATMPNDQIIMAFNSFFLGLRADQIPGARVFASSGATPTINNGILTAFNQEEHDALVQKWTRFLLTSRLHYINFGYEVWMQDMIHVSYFNDRIAQDINQLLDTRETQATQESQETQDL